VLLSGEGSYFQKIMSNKRKGRNTHKFYCPYCDKQLWRLGSPKHYLFFIGAEEVKQQFNLSRKVSALLTAQEPVQVDQNTWLEEFFCESHGRMWLVVKKSEDGTLQSLRVANKGDWQRSVTTYDPDLPNASVGEFSYRMSRGKKLRKHSKQLNPI
jgi:hypothetical protein